MTAKTSTSTVLCDQRGKLNRNPAAASGAPRCGNCQEPLPWIADAEDAPAPALREWLEQAIGERK